MANVRTIRLSRDLEDFIVHAPESVVLTAYDEERMKFVKFAVSGPPETLYEGSVFQGVLKLPADFPRRAPDAVLETPIWHPNIGLSGKICYDLISDWKPGRTLLQLAVGVQSLLADPNPGSPLNADASIMMREDINLYNNTVTMWCCVHAGGPRTRPEEYQAKLSEVMEAAQIDEEAALKRLSLCSWDVQDAICMRRNRH